MIVFREELTVSTRSSRSGFVDVTRQVEQIVARSKVQTGLLNVFIAHTSASLVIQENADPRVLDDLSAWMAKAVPQGPHYSHDDEGPDDMPGHIRSAITKTSETIPVTGGRLALGTWQALYLWEHRARPHERRLTVTVIGQ